MISRPFNLFVFFLFSLSGVSQSDDESTYAIQVLETAEYKAKNNEITELSNEQRCLSLLLVSEPNESQSHFSYVAIEDNGLSYVTHLHFRVYPMLGIFLYDPELDEEIWLSKE